MPFFAACGSSGSLDASTSSPEAATASAVPLRAYPLAPVEPTAATIAGRVEGVDDAIIQIVDAGTGSIILVHLAPAATVQRQERASLAEITPGTSLATYGVQTGDRLAAARVTLNVTDSGTTATRPSNVRLTTLTPLDEPEEKLSAPIHGIVTQATDTGFTLQCADGAVLSITLLPGGIVERISDVDASAIDQGMMVVAQGAQQGSRFEATHVLVLLSSATP